MTSFADSQVTYRDFEGAWGSFRLKVGGFDCTYFRGIPAQISSYQLTEPYSYGSAEFALPSLTQFEVDDWGTGALWWMGNGKPVQLVQVDAAGTLVRTVWQGFVTVAEVTSGGVLLHCDGEASGTLALRTKRGDLFSLPRTVGQKIYAAMKDCHLPLSPYLGGQVGAKTDARGMAGSYLDYVGNLLAATIDTDGSQYTIHHRPQHGDYFLDLKDTTTVDFSVFVGAAGVEIDLSDDLSERPNTIYGSGVAPSGLIWGNGKYPGMVQGGTPPYPMTDDSSFSAGTTDADTDTGDGVTVMISKLIGMDYMDLRDAPGAYDSDVTSAIKDLQADAGLTESGNMNTATWDALFDLGVTGFSLFDAYTAPLAQASKVQAWLTTSNGSLKARNPNFDPSIKQVDLDVDHGPSVEKSRARRYSKGVLHRAQQSKNWAGPVTLTSDVFAGDWSYGAADATPMSRLDIKAGMNGVLRNFDGDTLVHVSIVNVAADLSVTLGCDTQARDAATLGEVIQRRIESRSRPARHQWLQQRKANANDRHIEFSEVGGRIFESIDCPGNEWTVFPVLAGQAGTASRVRLQTSGSQAAFVMAITAKKTEPTFWHNKVTNPLAGVPIDDVSLNASGNGYTSAPTVSISGAGPGSGATATATITASTNTGGGVTGLTLTTLGTGYTTVPTVTLTGGGGTGATAIVPSVGSGALGGLYVTASGTGYTSAPTVSFSGGGGSGATATAQIGPGVPSGGHVTALTVTDHGAGYVAPPQVTFSGGGGSDAKAYATISLKDHWSAQKLQKLIDDERALLGVWGTPAQPCGYFPGSLTNARGEISGDAITGLMVEDGGFDYHTFGQPVVYVAIYPDRDTTIKPQRILWDVLESNT